MTRKKAKRRKQRKASGALNEILAHIGKNPVQITLMVWACGSALGAVLILLAGDVGTAVAVGALSAVLMLVYQVA